MNQNSNFLQDEGRGSNLKKVFLGRRDIDYIIFMKQHKLFWC